MKLKTLRLRDFRGIAELTLHFDKTLTVLVGENGVGKTSLLDATSFALFGLRSFWPENSERTHYRPKIETSDIAIGKSDFSIDVQVSYGRSAPNALILDFDLSSQSGHNSQSVSKLSIAGLSQWNSQPIPQPLFAYYRQSRGFRIRNFRSQLRDISNIISEKNLREQSLSEDLQAIQDLSVWWDNLDAQEARHCRDIDSTYRDPQLQAVRNLIQEMDEFETIKFEAKSLRPGLYLKKGNGPQLHVEQLSSGERVYLILLADLARRLQIIMPDADLKDIPGIVLIDEIELNLHPNWQRRITSTLTRIFKSCQFIVSTHSPQVIGQVREGRIAVLHKDDEGTIQAGESSGTYGKDSNDILIDVLRSTERDQAIKSQLEKLERSISQKQLAQARDLIERLRVEIGDNIIELDIAEQRLRRRERRSDS